MFLLAALYIAVIVVWATRVLDHHRFSINNIGVMTQAVSISSQIFTVGILGVLSFIVQLLSSDRMIRSRAPTRPYSIYIFYLISSPTGITVAALHRGLGSWRQGFGTSMVNILKYRHFSFEMVRLIATCAFFASISILHISAPSVITVKPFNASRPFSAVANRMPGSITKLTLSDEFQANVSALVSSIPYLWNQRESGIGQPPGLNKTSVNNNIVGP